jgi:hypothetical protein
MPIKMFQETAKVLLALMIDWLASAGEELPGEGVFLSAASHVGSPFAHERMATSW